MQDLRFRDRVVVFVGIAVCTVFDWLKRAVTREKADVYTPERAAAGVDAWNEGSFERRLRLLMNAEQAADMAKSLMGLALVNASDEQITVFCKMVASGRADVLDMNRLHETGISAVGYNKAVIRLFLRTHAKRLDADGITVDFFPPGTTHSSGPPKGAVPKDEDWDF